MRYRNFILIPHLKLHNANAMSSPYTIGFPAMTAWLGAIHALQRKLQATGYRDITLDRMAISCHHFDLQTYKGQNDFDYSIIGTANPLDKDGSRPAFIEECRCDTEVSILIESLNFNVDPDEYAVFKNQVNQLIFNMKFASGDVLDVEECELIKFDNYDEECKEIKLILNKLMLGHVLIERRDLVQNMMREEQKDALDAMLDYLKVTYSASQDNNNVTWVSKRKSLGWIVPIAVGFHRISEIGIVKNQRDSVTPHGFAESVVTLGEFVMPYRIKQIDRILWHYNVERENNLYLCKNLTI